jgi:hypothetical protein
MSRHNCINFINKNKWKNSEYWEFKKDKDGFEIEWIRFMQNQYKKMLDWEKKMNEKEMLKNKKNKININNNNNASNNKNNNNNNDDNINNGNNNSESNNNNNKKGKKKSSFVSFLNKLNPFSHVKHSPSHRSGNDNVMKYEENEDELDYDDNYEGNCDINTSSLFSSSSSLDIPKFTVRFLSYSLVRPIILAVSITDYNSHTMFPDVGYSTHQFIYLL